MWHLEGRRSVDPVAYPQHARGWYDRPKGDFFMIRIASAAKPSCKALRGPCVPAS